MTAIRGPPRLLVRSMFPRPNTKFAVLFINCHNSPAGIDDVAGLYNDADHKLLTIDIDRYFKYARGIRSSLYGNRK